MSASVVFGDALYGPRGSCGPRTQSDYQLVAVHRGEARVLVADQLVDIPTNHAALFRPGLREHFLFSLSGPTRHTWCSVAPSAVPEAMAIRLGQATPVVPISERLHRLIELGLGVPASPDQRENALIESLGIALLEAFLLECSTIAEPYPKPLRLALQRIEGSLSAEWDAARLADNAGVSVAHLIRLFRAHLDTTPAKYLWETRTRKGVELLRETGLPVAEIAHRVGFTSAFHFSRRVREGFGLSPRDLRAQAWGQAKGEE